MYKSFYEQVFYEVQQESTRNAFQALEALQPYFKKSGGIQGSIAAFLQDLPLKNYFPTSHLTQERRKV
jgi:hypothetical protein